jgi:hypothetical protein
MPTRLLSVGLCCVLFCLSLAPPGLFASARKIAEPEPETAQHSNQGPAPVPRQFMVWTELSQSDLESVLPRGATIRLAERNGYLVGGVTDHVQFASDVGALTGQKRMRLPRFGREGQCDPGELPARVKEWATDLAQLVHDIIYFPDPPAGAGQVPPGPLPKPEEIKALLPKGWVGNGPVPPPPGGGGGWEVGCEPQSPCVRPQEPTPQTVDDCKREQEEVDVLLERYLFWEKMLELVQQMEAVVRSGKAISDGLDGPLLVMAGYAAATTPYYVTAAGAIAGGPLGGLVLVAPLLVTYITKKIINYVFLNNQIEELKKQMDLVKAAARSYFNGYNDALRELEACKKKAADTEAANTAAFQNFINVLLPAYYECLKRRKCRRTWNPK